MLAIVSHDLRSPLTAVLLGIAYVRRAAAEGKPHVFDRYWQASDKAHLGTGLGLFIARTIVASHGGRIDAESRRGEGSTFSVALRREGSDPAS
jgi:signal transduction histidine kinase